MPTLTREQLYALVWTEPTLRSPVDTGRRIAGSASSVCERAFRFSRVAGGRRRLLGRDSKQAALIRYLASSATINPEIPDSGVLEGLGDLSAEIEELARAVKSAMSVNALDETV